MAKNKLLLLIHIGVVIQNINTISSNEEYLYEVTVLTHSVQELEKFMSDLRNINTIFDVERDIK